MRALIIVLTFAFTIASAEARHYRHHHEARAAGSSGEVIGGRPAGCPWQYCGCGASLYLFGRIIPTLNLAANWLRFPHALPAPRMAAVRQHHVMVLESHVSGDIWIVHDSNYGNHLTRRHPQSIAGYVIVDPTVGRIGLSS
jgi:hypothetical protein